MENADVLAASAFGDKDHPTFIAMQTAEMRALSTNPSSAKHVDTTESMKSNSYFKDGVWVTMTSVFDEYTAHQMPWIITVHTDKSERGHRCHFNTDQSNFKSLDPPLLEMPRILLIALC